MNSITTEGNSWEDPNTLGPGSLEDLGASEWLRRFTSMTKQHPRYDLNSNKGPFLGGLLFILERFHNDASMDGDTSVDEVTEIMTALKNKNRNFSLRFIVGVVGHTTGDKIEIVNRIAAFALILEYNRMGKDIHFMKHKLLEHPDRWERTDHRYDCLFSDNFIQELIRYEKQWELDTLVDIHRQESMQSLF